MCSVCGRRRDLKVYKCRTLFRIIVCFLFLLLLLAVIFVSQVRLLSGNQRQPTCAPRKNHFSFLRVPQTGTSTTTLMFWRLAIKRNWTVLLPKPNVEETLLAVTKTTCEVSSPPYDMVSNQLVYNPDNLALYTSPDMAYVALLREPFQHIQSVIYARHDYLKTLREGDGVDQYLNDPAGYEQRFQFLVSLTNNPYAFYFGMQKPQFHDTEAVESLISKIDSKFVVLILEYFDESLIMLKRTLCWSFQDLIYKVENVGKHRPRLTVDNATVSKHRKWAMADYKIYHHFLQKFHRYVQRGGADFQDEVREFKDVLRVIHEFCNSSRSSDILHLRDGVFFDHIKYTSADCDMLSFPGVKLRNIIRERQGTPLE